MLRSFVLANCLLLIVMFPAAAATGNEPLRFASAGMNLTLEEIARIDGVVWGLDFIDQETAIFTVRHGDVMLLDLATGDSHPLNGAPQVHRVMGGGPFNQVPSGGLFDVLVDLDFSNNRLIYLAYVKKVTEGHALAVARARVAENELVDLRDIFIANNASEEAGRWGTRLAMDKERNLFIAAGDRRVGSNAQDLNNHCGKILRIRPDGSIPKDNPFVGREDAAPEVWSYGHRNPQGLAFHPQTGRLFEHEHGPDGGDEINVIEPGRNYGWPVIGYGRTRTGKPAASQTEKDGMEQPLKYFDPGIAPSGMSFSGSGYYPGWNNDLFIGSLNRMRLNRIYFDGRIVSGEELLLSEWQQRVRDVAEGPDGMLYVVTDAGHVARIRLSAAAP